MFIFRLCEHCVKPIFPELLFRYVLAIAAADSFFFHLNGDSHKVQMRHKPFYII